MNLKAAKFAFSPSLAGDLLCCSLTLAPEEMKSESGYGWSGMPTKKDPQKIV